MLRNIILSHQDAEVYYLSCISDQCYALNELIIILEYLTEINLFGLSIKNKIFRFSKAQIIWYDSKSYAS